MIQNAILSGLSSKDVEAKLREHGPNLLSSSRPKTGWKIFFEITREPMVFLLLACGGVYFVMGDLQESIPLFVSVVFLLGISFFQKYKSERAVDALKSLASPRALVIRDGKENRIAAKDVVPGDLLVLREGDRVPADAQLLEWSSFRVDESLLTGESVPVEKKKGESALVFASTLVVAGKALAQVVKTGDRTEVGKIGVSLQEGVSESSHLEREIRTIVWRFGVVGVLFSVLIVMVFGWMQGDWARGVLAGLAAAMSLLPEEFPLVMTLFFSVGAWRISRDRVLTLELRAIETLGSISTLCVDKTGTLTENQMRLTALATLEEQMVLPLSHSNLPESFHQLIEYGVLASHTDAFDPMDRAIREVLNRTLKNSEHAHADWELLKEYPLSAELMAMSCVWKDPVSKRRVVASKGAPEVIVDLCHLSPSEAERVSQKVKEMSVQGLRVLGVAQAEFSGDPLPDHPHVFSFRFVGLLGMEDPLRADIPRSIEACRIAGIRVVMLTGDHLETAKTIAMKAGFPASTEFVTGPMLETMTDDELKEKIQRVGVFARVVPSHKLRIVEALRAQGEIVGMTGDGVNDAPALKRADVGISMGKRGTDVAREASDLVLLDDEFSSIVKAIRMGRRIYENIQHAMAYIFAVHVPIAGLAIIPVLFKLPLMILPAQIVFLELIIDPACTLAFEAEEESSDLMKRPPRSLRDRPFGWKKVFRASLQGLVVLFFCLAALMWSRSGFFESFSDESTRSLVFSTLVFGNLALIFVNRVRWRSNGIAWGVILGALALLALVLEIPYLNRVMGIQPLSLVEIGIALGLGIAAFLGANVLGKWIQVSPVKPLRL